MKDLKPCLKGIWRVLRMVRGKVALCSLLYALEAASSLAFVWFCKQVVDIATGQLDASLTSGILILVLIMLFRVADNALVRYYQGRITVSTKNKLRTAIFEKALRSRWDGKDRYHSADMSNRMEEDIRVLTDFVCSLVPECAVTVLQLIAAVIMLFTLSSQLALILIWIMPVAVVAARLYFRKVRALTTEIRAIDGRIQGHLQETLQHRVLVKTLGSVDDSQQGLTDLQDQEYEKTKSKLGYTAFSRSIMMLGYSTGYLAAFIWGVVGLKDGSVTYGLMVAFLQMVGQVQRPVAALASYVPSFISAISSQERLLEVEELEQETAEEPVRFADAAGIRFENVNFAYSDRESGVLKDFSFDFKPGQITVITGPTGEGKSTIASLMLSLLQPASGRVIVYDSTREIPASPATRCNFLYVPQGNSLVSGTIRKNLLMARPSASEEELREALETAQASFVFDLPDGLDSQCAEIGRGLSEGQAQRIAIARALLHEGSIFILDESTSALDSETEEKLLAAIREKYCGSKTIIMITHRNAASAHADAHLAL